MDELKSLPLRSGANMPSVGFGTWQLRDGGDEAYSATLAALQAGYRHIDTASIYGNEASIGRAIKDSGIPRQELFVTTKLWNDDHAHVHQAFEDSRNRLGLEYIDLYLIHWPVPARHSSWQTLENIQKSGAVRSIGVSNFTIEHLNQLFDVASVLPAVNQVEFSPFLFQRELLDFCRSQRITLTAYSPLTKGRKLDHPTIVRAAESLNKTPAQVMLRWALQHGVAVLPKSKTPERIKENIELFDWEIDEHTMLLLDQLNEDLRLSTDPNTFK